MFLSQQILPCPKSRHRKTLHIDLDTGTIFDGGADDNDCLLPFDEVDLYCEKKYGVSLELPQFTNGRAEQITAYIRTALRKAI